ncbi:MAG: aminotransferase class IV [Pseudomonadota bacterium]
MADFSDGAAFVYGELVPIAEAKISLLDWGFLHSDATYDVVHVWEGRFFRLDDHLDRFHDGMAALRMVAPYPRERIRSVLADCVAVSGLRNAYVEMITTRGQPRPGSRDPRSCVNQFFAFAIPFVRIAEPNHGLHLLISDRQRIPPQSVDPTVKNYHWLDLVMGQFDAFDRGAETVAVVDENGNVTEGPGFNVFAVSAGTLTTPASGVLRGVTRRTAIEIAAALGHPLVEAPLSPAQVHAADEVFATSTAGGIMPITRVDRHAVGNGAIGPITRALQARYWSLHGEPAYTTAVDYAARSAS